MGNGHLSLLHQPPQLRASGRLGGRQCLPGHAVLLRLGRRLLRILDLLGFRTDLGLGRQALLGAALRLEPQPPRCKPSPASAEGSGEEGCMGCVLAGAHGTQGSHSRGIPPVRLEGRNAGWRVVRTDACGAGVDDGARHLLRREADGL